MKIVYSLSLLHGIEISLFSIVYLFRNYFPFYAGGFVYVAFRFSLFLVSRFAQFTLYLANVVVRRNIETLRFMEYPRTLERVTITRSLTFERRI